MQALSSIEDGVERRSPRQVEVMELAALRWGRIACRTAGRHCVLYQTNN